MRLPAPHHFVTAALTLVTLSLSGCTSSTSTASSPKPSATVALSSGDPLIDAIDQRFGRPYRVTGSGRAFLHYDLSNGDTITLVVSGGRIIGLQHDQKQK